MVGPFIVLFIILCTWAVVSYAIGVVVTSDQSAGAGIVAMARTINVILGFLGILSVIAIPVGFVVGIIHLVKKDSSSETPPTLPPQAPTV